MKNKIIVCLLIMLILGISFFGIKKVLAEQVNKDLIINIQCSNSTYANISSIMYKPNSTYITKGEYSMTKSGTNYNYTLNSTLNNKIGTLEVNYHCDVNGIDTTAGYLIDITTTGEQVSLSNIIIVIAFLIIASILFILGYTFDKEKFILKTGFFIFALFMCLIALNSGRIIASESQGLSEMSNVGIILLIAIILLMLLYIFIYWTIKTFKSFKQKKEERWSY